jgi:hypothetical protein
MTQIHGLISPCGLGTAKKAELSVAMDAKYAARPKGRWYEKG